jgi:DNA repair and recombination protein RAD52
MRDHSGAETVPNRNGERLATPLPTGFVNSRAAELLNTENRGPQSPDVPAFNPHVSGNIPRTKGIDHSKSTPISRQVVTKVANEGNAAPAPRMNFVNPQADTNRKIGMPMSVVPSPLANRSAYKPPRPAGTKRGLEGLPRAPLTDVSNVQPGAAVDADAKRPRLDNGAAENSAPGPEKANG